MQSTMKQIKNHIKIDDWSAVSKDVDNFDKQLAKASAIVRKEGVPKFYFKQILELDQLVKDAFGDKNAKAKMSQVNAKALNGLKQKLRKTIQKYPTEIEEYKKLPLVDEKDNKDDEVTYHYNCCCCCCCCLAACPQ
jgi:translation initiation factor 3 subunit C